MGESGRAEKTIEGAFPRSADELVLIESDAVVATDPSFRGVVADVEGRLKKVRYTQDFESPYAPGNAGQISSDGRSALLRFEIVGDDDETQDRVGLALQAVSAAQAANPDFTVAESGDASVNKSINDSISDDFKQALFTSLPITLVILLVASVLWSRPEYPFCWRSPR